MKQTRQVASATGGAATGGASLRARVLWLVAAALLPSLGLSAWVLVRDEQRAVEAAYEKAGVLANSTSSALQWALQESQAELQGLADRYASHGDLECDELPIQPPSSAATVSAPELWTPEGLRPCATPPAPQPPAAPEWLAHALTAGEFRASSPWRRSADGRWLAVLSMPLLDSQGRPKAVLASTVDLARLNERLFRRLPEGALVAVIDRQHRVVLRSAAFADRVGQQVPPRFRDAVGAGEAAFLAETGVDGVKRLYATRSLERSGWRVWAALPEQQALADWRADRTRTLAAMGAALALLSVLGWWLLRSTLGPVQALAQAARRAAAGEADARAPVDGPAELRDVAREFNRMLDAGSAATEALQASEARFRALTELSSDWYWEQDADLRFVSISDGVGRSLGLDPSVHIGRYRWDLPGMIGPDAAAWAEHRAVLERHEPFHDFEMKRAASDGSIHVFQVSGIPLFDEGGRFRGYRGIGRDVTAQRRAEEAERSREARFRTLVDQLPVGVVEHAADTSISLFNAEACRLLGMSADQMTGRTAPDPAWHFVAESGQRLTVADYPVVRVIATDAPLQGLILGIVAHEGADPTWVHVNAFPEHGEDGQLRRVVVVFIDITARRQAEALREARDMAELANRAKTAFLSRVSHELRTPLNAVLGFSQLLQIDPAVQGSVTTASQVDAVHRAGEHLLALVDDLLDLARIEAGEMRVTLEPIRLAEVTAECMAMVQPLADASRLQLRLVTDRGVHDATVLAERSRLRQILINVLTNAVKYNRPGGEVTVSLVAEQRRAGISVRDTGVGMSELQQASLFQPFNRLGAEARGVEGTGLGLVISRQLVELMGGSLQVTSSAGAGSTFVIWLPRSDLPERSDEPLRTLPQPALRADGSGLDCVVVEDNRANAQLVSQALALRPQVSLHMAADGIEGIRRIREVRPRLVLLDLDLPGMDGYAVLAAMQQEGLAQPATTVIALTAWSTAQDVARARAAGFDDVITKPFVIQRLLDAVDGVPLNT